MSDPWHRLAALRPRLRIPRSIAIYHGQPWKLRRARALYAHFIKPGDLCFDIGAHVGDRVGYFLSLGARVVAVEPQPAAMAVLRHLYGRNPRVTLVQAAAGGAIGEAVLPLAPPNPHLATPSESWAPAVGRSPALPP